MVDSLSDPLSSLALVARGLCIDAQEQGHDHGAHPTIDANIGACPRHASMAQTVISGYRVADDEGFDAWKIFDRTEAGILPIPNQVQMIMAAHVPGHGWLATKRGVSYGGKHGEPPLLDSPDLADLVVLEAKSGARSMQHAYRRAMEEDEEARRELGG